MPLKSQVKGAVERLFGCHIYRDWALPHGFNVFIDINKRIPTYKPKLIFDVGANVGQSASGFLDTFPTAKIYCFEPISATFQKLRANTHQWANVSCFNLAFGSAKGAVRVLLEDASVNNSLLNVAKKDTSDRVDTNEESVAVETLSDFCRGKGISKIDFLKIDTEGYDLEVLKGAGDFLKTRQISFIQVEAGMNSLNKKHVPLNDFVEFFDKYGYVLFGIYDQTQEWSGEARLRFSNPVFVSGNIASVIK